MSDARLTPANGRVAHVALRGQVDAARFVEGAARLLCVPVADLLHAPDGRRQRLLLMGARVTCLETHAGWSFVQGADGYVGYVKAQALGDAGPAPTHRVSARATHVYAAPDIKSRDIATLSHLSEVAVIAQQGAMAQTPMGYIPAVHLSALDAPARDPVGVATLYLGTPYLWGGNSAFGLDCSGLVQAGCRACGIPCPGDSDLQEATLGARLPPGTPPQRGDLLFWKGHVAWVVDSATILHANARDMAVAHEHLPEAIHRIEAQGGGPVTAHKRPGEQP